MTFVPHLRLSMLGGLPGGEIWSASVSLTIGPNHDLNQGSLTNPLPLAPDDDQWNNMVADTVAFFQSAGACQPPDNTLKTVKIAQIGADGLYLAPPVERVVNVAGTHNYPSNDARKANQTALAVTLHTAGDLGRVKGRFYLPMPNYGLQSDGRIHPDDRAACAAAAHTYVQNLNNEPGFDLLNLSTVVASQGRKRRGVQVVPPKNHVVTGVSVGMVPDTIRRRRNHLQEQRVVLSI